MAKHLSVTCAVALASESHGYSCKFNHAMCHMSGALAYPEHGFPKHCDCDCHDNPPYDVMADIAGVAAGKDEAF